MHIKQTGINEIRKDPVLRLLARYCDAKFRQLEAAADERLKEQSDQNQMYRTVQWPTRKLDPRTRDGGEKKDGAELDALSEAVAAKVEQYTESVHAAANSGNPLAEDIVHRARAADQLRQQLEHSFSSDDAIEEMEALGWGSDHVTKIDLSNDDYIKRY